MVAVALLLSVAFGAVDQYLGSFSMHPWMVDVSLLSAPWLVLPFVCGATRETARSAALLGLGCTFAALLGYGLMTLSPVENAHLTVTTAAGFVRSSARVFLGGLVTGPVFGWLGQRWRHRQAWWAGWLTAGALLLEPAAHTLSGDPTRSHAVVAGELAAGLLCAAGLAWRSLYVGRGS